MKLGNDAISSFACALVLVSRIEAGVEVNGGFEMQSLLGWPTWQAPWSVGPSVDPTWAEDPFEGTSALHLQAASGSFGVYQEFCVEAGKSLRVDWAWKGSATTDGWWEVLIIDAPYSYDAADNPSGHPETLVASKWEFGFGSGLPEPAADWETGTVEITPSADTIAVVLKCGSTTGGVDAFFDDVRVEHSSALLEIASVDPAKGKVAGGEIIKVLGRVFPEGSKVSLGTTDLVDGIRSSTCEVTGTTPPGTPGLVDVVLSTPSGNATVVGGFQYVGPPTIDSIEPASGPIEGGTAVTIRGSGFETVGTKRVILKIGAKFAVALVVVDPLTLTATTPSGAAGAVDVTVTTPFGAATLALGFTYGTVGPSFRRGDCNSDGILNISDPISLLGYLFLGSETPSCIEACNGDDDGEVSLTDAVRVLGFLFTGGLPPAAPYPDCGLDPAADLSCEVSHPGC
jgi:hypothetical protein